MSSFRCGCERGEVVSGGRRSSSWWWRQFRARRWFHPGATSLRVRVVCLERAVECVVRLHAGAPPRSREGGTRVLPRGRRVNGSLHRSGRAASICVFVPCSLWFSSLPCLGVLVVVDRLRSVSQMSVPRGTEQGESAVARLVCVETVRPLRGHARSCAGVVARLRVLDRQRRRADRKAVRTRSVLSDGVWRARVVARPRQRRRWRPTGPEPPIWRLASSGMRLGASPDVPFWGRGRSTSGGSVRSAPALSCLVRAGPSTRRSTPSRRPSARRSTPSPQTLGAIAKDVSFLAGRQAERDRTTGR